MEEQSKHEQYLLLFIKNLKKYTDEYKIINIKKLYSVVSSITNREIKNLKIGKVLSKCALFKIYLRLLYYNKIERFNLLETLLVTKASRSNSGVLVITTIMPHEIFSCEFDCHYCPNECIANGAKHNIARSYLSNEGIPRRSLVTNHQVIRRLIECESMGHMPNKIELIILGGTFHCYGKKIYREFIHNLFYACNIYNNFSIRYKGKFAPLVLKWLDKNPFYNNLDIDDLLPLFSQLRKRGTLEEEKNLNQNAICARIISLVPETRPDQIQVKRLVEFRELGVTRFQIGAQSTNDIVLKIVNRGHRTGATKRALELALNAGFKEAGHIMPDMPGSNPKKDTKMVEDFFFSDDLQFDRVKLYPCLDVPWTEIRKWKQRAITMIENGEKEKVLTIHEKMINGDIKGLTKNDYVWLPSSEYNYQEFFNMMVYAMKIVPPWTRLDRLNRDFLKATDKNNRIGYESDNIKPNLYQLCKNELKKQKTKPYDIRSREIGRRTPYNFREQAKLFIRCYRSSKGTEFFISVEIPEINALCPDDAILMGLLRLRIPDLEAKTTPAKYLQKGPSRYLPLFKNRVTARIREVHVFGNVKPVIDLTNKKVNSQHMGVGTFLLGVAEEISYSLGIDKLAVISGVGVRGYYEKKGYTLEQEYMTKIVTKTNKNKLILFDKKYSSKHIMKQVYNFKLVKLFFPNIKNNLTNSEVIYNYPKIKNAQLIIFENNYWKKQYYIYGLIILCVLFYIVFNK